MGSLTISRAMTTSEYEAEPYFWAMVSRTLMERLRFDGSCQRTSPAWPELS